MAATKFSLCNTALAELRVPAIASFNDGSTAAIVAGNTYEQRVLEVFGILRWEFAKDQEDLVREAIPPKQRWANYFTMPASCLLLHTVLLNDKPILYAVYGNSIGCDLGDDDIPTAEFTRKINEGDWPPYFQALITAKMKISFAGGVTGKAELLGDARNEYAKAELVARRADAQMKTTKKMVPSRLVSTR